jgi:hypothetical protein
MLAVGLEEDSVGAGQDCFATTHWSVVLEARSAESPGAGEARERLCRAYSYPLYAYVRRKGYGSHDAADLIQEFFADCSAGIYLPLSVLRQRWTRKSATSSPP